MKILGREITVKKKDDNNKSKRVPLESLSVRDFESYVQAEVERTGMTVAQVIEETFHDGWLTWVYESKGSSNLDASQLYKSGKNKDGAEEFVRLRRNFAPISACVDYIRDSLLGGGIDVIISDPKNNMQKELKKYLKKLIDDVYQDEYTRGLLTIMSILVDQALTTGVAAAEITYKGDPKFWQYAKISDKSKMIVKINDKDTEVVIFDIQEPKWTDFKGLTRLKILENAHNRLRLQRDLAWEAKYWVLDEGKNENLVKLSSGVQLRRTYGEGTNMPKGTVAGTYFHTWQMFWLTLNRIDYSENGESVIKPVLSLAQTLEKIISAVGSGISRAGNKKYFIVCGTEKRPWSGPHIRNVLQQLQEASKKGWSTIPMPRGFSIEEIGGEIFEAENVVEYMKKLIARGMNVPAKILGVYVRDEPEFTYNIMKTNLATAIKHQLFKRHIWCKYGETKTKKGGKGDKLVYVPDVRFKTEDLLTIVQKLDVYKAMLNPANPIRPEVKLEVERGLCELMGWDEVLLPSQEEYRQELEEARKEQEELLKKKIGVIGKIKKGMKSVGGKILGKRQGQPVAQTRERQEKRLEGMAKQGKGERGISREMGTTRQPIEETVPEDWKTAEDVAIELLSKLGVGWSNDRGLYAQYLKHRKIDRQLNELLSRPTEKREVTIEESVIDKSKCAVPAPVEITLEQKPLKVIHESNVTVKSPLDKEMRELAEHQEELLNLQKKLAKEESDKKKKKLQKEIENLELDVEKNKTNIELKKKAMEMFEAQTRKAEVESEEIKKTHAKKREAIKKAKEVIEKEKTFIDGGDN